MTDFETSALYSLRHIADMTTYTFMLLAVCCAVKFLRWLKSNAR